MRAWQGKEWERWVNSLLRAHYSAGEYQEVPDAHGGDFGIEGFSFDGCAYQSYSPQEPLRARERYDKQRDKITADVGKFIANHESLTALFGEVVIRRWILVVPTHDSGQLLQHARRKEADVRAAGLPYVSGDFRIVVVTDEYFEIERQTLLGAGIGQVRYAPTLPHGDPTDVLEATEGGSNALDNLLAKSERIPSLVDEPRRQEFRGEIAHRFLAGQSILEQFRRDSPLVYEELLLEKRAREQALIIESFTSTEQPGDRITQEVARFELAVRERFPNIHRETTTAVALEAVADWILRCPLDFPTNSRA